ncbi:Iron sulfur domain-containing, CDGSH-type [Marinithermus hydrothermalis DSM 14884]|uniref:Iron sulfur domain-containing, CDGSH-type n=2 Tax=Marinithermus TaxID=186191 RepID=F2NMV8_MARHT|nr:Iron sulfur domain-containing, CDGSH-type [Marinithermus hydrothermalis DSM 14884]
MGYGMKIVALKNGPFVLETGGRYVIQKDGKEEVVEKPRVSLCRCGASKNQPFCDGEHKKIGFEAPAAELEVGPVPVER